jgi:integrase
MEQKKCLARTYKTYPVTPTEADMPKVWYIYCVQDKAMRYKQHPITRQSVNNQQLTFAQRLAIANGICAYYNTAATAAIPTPALSAVQKYSPIIITRLRGALADAQPNIRKSTHNTYTSKINILEAYLRQHNIAELTQDVAERFLAEIKATRKPATVNAYKVTIQRLLPKEEKKILEDAKHLKVFPEGAMYFTRSEIVRLHETIAPKHPQLWLACMFVFYCFIRPRAELLKLRISDLNFQAHTLTVPGDVSKNHRTQTVVIPRPLMTLLDEWQLHRYPKNYYIIGKNGTPNDVPMTNNYLGEQHRLILLSLGFDTQKYKMYSWKNTGLIEAIKSGIDIVSLQRQVRHHSLDQLNQYLREVGAIQCAQLYTHFPSIEQLKPTDSVLHNYIDDMLRLLQNAQRHEVPKNERYQLSLMRAEIDRIIG